MKKTLILMLCAVALAVSCKKSDPAVYVRATATIKNGPEAGQCFLQIDDKTAMLPTNLSKNPFGQEQRVLAYYYDKGAIEAPAGSLLEWRSGQLACPLYSILTKATVSQAEGTAGVEIVRSWANTIEDGYMTLHFEGLWGGTTTVHEVNLEKKFSADSLCYVFKHNANGDPAIYRTRGLVAFRVGEDIEGSGKTGEFDVFVSYLGYFKSKRIKFHHYADGTYSAPVSDTVYQLEGDDDSVENLSPNTWE